MQNEKSSFRLANVFVFCLSRQRGSENFRMGRPCWCLPAGDQIFCCFLFHFLFSVIRKYLDFSQPAVSLLIVTISEPGYEGSFYFVVESEFFFFQAHPIQSKMQFSLTNVRKKPIWNESKKRFNCPISLTNAFKSVLVVRSKHPQVYNSVSYGPDTRQGLFSGCGEQKQIEWAPVILSGVHITGLLVFRSLAGLWNLRSVTGEGELIVMGCPLTTAVARHFWQALRQAAT